MASLVASKAARKYAQGALKAYEPVDPYYEFIVDHKGRQKRVKRDVPPGLSKRDEKALRKIRKRAHYLDKGVNLCGFRVGWTFFIGIIPVVGDVTDAVLNYGLVLRPATKLDLPTGLTAQMLFNNAVSAGVGLVPLVGDVALAAWKANWRNAHLLEEYLRKRGEENLRSGGTSALTEVTETTAAETLAASGIATPVHTAAAPMVATPSGSRPQTPVGADGQKPTKKGWFSFGSRAAKSAQANTEEEEDNTAEAHGLTANARKPAAGVNPV